MISPGNKLSDFVIMRNKINRGRNGRKYEGNSVPAKWKDYKRRCNQNRLDKWGHFKNKFKFIDLTLIMLPHVLVMVSYGAHRQFLLLPYSRWPPGGEQGGVRIGQPVELYCYFGAIGNRSSVSVAFLAVVMRVSNVFRQVAIQGFA